MTILTDKVAIITGASSGIGKAAAKLFSQAGASVVLSGRRSEELADVVAEIKGAGGSAVSVTGDVRAESHAKKLVETAIEEFGGLDIAFNNVGSSGAMGAVTDLTLDGWDDTLRTNLTSAFLSAKHQLPALINRGGGALVFTSSFVGNTVGFPGMAAYAAAKAGLVGLVQTIAAEFGSRGVRANALLPGGTDTPSNAANLPGAASETRGFIEGLHALKRLARPEEIAQAALFLVSPAASFMTGAAVLADGGVSINRT
ncbi:SDR family oxidoreductase [Pseudaminobacter sp. 19-2017]|uniref:SDR family oxidoreductase n=1 Tax=Pseudaminobacter soli (ex Zhang et al. 2022) TaxID=2831468 RepID=A0A942I9R4_9HYPH|nr:SDR family oxidoreductase [Pseudaminobacter soli]MBS3650585.1 SDR family oxidoreductase [Pseudaminobacter soli]